MVRIVAAVLAALATIVSGQVSQCMSLSGSALCPAFQSLSINPANLSNSWPFFASVYNVATFDAALSSYLAPGGAFAKQKQRVELGCNNFGTGAVLQWQRTFLCGEFTTVSYSATCNSNNTDVMTCQQTCWEFADSERSLVERTDIGPQTAASRAGNITNDFARCTDWKSLASNSSETCVLGSRNEPNCGFAASQSQLCDHCNPANGTLVAPCCVSENTALGACGYTLTAANIIGYSGTASTSALPTFSSVATSTETATPLHRLSNGALAGAIVGSLLGTLLLVLLIIGMFLLLRRRWKNQRHARRGSGTVGTVGSTQTLFKEGGATSGTGSLNDGPTPRPFFTSVFSGTPALAAGAALGDVRNRHSGEESVYESDPEASGRVVVDSFQDLYSAQLIRGDSTVEVLYSYNPALPDELRLQPGEHVFVFRLYDDNWADGQIEDTDGELRSGVFPLVCVTGELDSEALTTSGSTTSDSRTGDNPSAYHSALSERGSSYEGGADAAARDRSMVASQNQVFPSRKPPSTK